MKHVTMGLLAALALAPGVGRAADPAYGPAAPVYRQISGWLIACDNTRSCVAKALPEEGGPDAPDVVGYVRFSREGGPTGAAQVQLAAEAPFKPEGMRLDGKPLAVPGWTYSKDDDAQELKGEAALAFMRLIRNGSVLQLAAGKDAPQASLHGLTAALLAMDEDQGRLGNASALARTGPAPATAVPAAPQPPLVHAAAPMPALAGAKAMIAAVRRSQAALLKARECDSKDNSTDSADALNGAEAIVVLNCSFTAYQGSVLAFRVPRAAPDKAALLVLSQPPVVPAADPTSVGQYVEGGYDAKTATFYQSAKGRGPADCGESESWLFDGRDFHLADLNYQDRCGGEPGDWPTLYRTKVAH